jgi:hypothetical protein
MELLDAMELMETHATRAAAADYLEKQVYTVQSKLREAWRVRHRGEAVVIPYYWTLSKVTLRGSVAALWHNDGGADASGSTATPVTGGVS